ncbi:MAG TPA: hypothetical protein VFV81_08370 [Verrucomicrobiae bacterium]|nr:hypothetical protein [Verrucomicrobiae bacterium]
MKKWATAALIIALSVGRGIGQISTYSFSFDGASPGATTPLSLAPDIIPIGSAYPTAEFTVSGTSYSIQSANVLGFTPGGFSGYCLYPDSIYASDLRMVFDRPVLSVSLMYAPEEYACDSSCTMEIRAYSGTNLVGTNVATAPVPGTWPTGVLGYTNDAQSFDQVVIHYLSPPPTGGDYGSIFMVDNLRVTMLIAASGQTNFSILSLGADGIMLSWPSSWSAYPLGLQDSTNLERTNGWFLMTNQPVLTYPVFNIVLPATNPQMYFRLVLTNTL